MSDGPRIKVLVAEDEPHLSAVLAQFLIERGCDVTTCGDGRVALDTLRAESFDVALLDILMPAMDGLEVLRAVREDAAPPEVIIITGNGSIDSAIGAMKLGAYDYLTKPYRMAEIDVLVRRAFEKRRLAREHAMMHARLVRMDAADEIVTDYAPLKAVLALVERVAKSDSPVLISGESGTGKELVARLVHRLSARADGPWVDLNGAAIAPDRMESELFGHEKGAFHGAGERGLGLLELASGGTLFLDQVGALDPKAQGKLLRALEQGMFYRAGGTQKVRSDFRIIAATNQDLAAQVGEGAFRADLYYRINAVSIHLPPLRERAVDIPLLAKHFLSHTAGGAARTLSVDALDALQAYPWPGNVRELRNVIERAALVASAPEVRAADLALGVGMPVAPARAAADPMTSLEEMERRHIDAVLRQVNWHQGRAADTLGISPKTLYRKIREYGISRPRHGGAGPA
ncbi:MAG TPA: sigma-54 dependent transcriptional regulator [Gemmatimonadaceae bacterium]|nr:sigma-54 dependent transcriptional regulator [Gemmatimonadaceae bacterium]